jgi:hypothetical protein
MILNRLSFVSHLDNFLIIQVKGIEIKMSAAADTFNVFVYGKKLKKGFPFTILLEEDFKA